MGRPCQKVKITTCVGSSRRPHSAWILWLAIDRNYLPIRQEAYTYHYSKSDPVGVGVAKDLREIAPGIWFPFAAEITAPAYEYFSCHVSYPSVCPAPGPYGPVTPHQPRGRLEVSTSVEMIIPLPAVSVAGRKCRLASSGPSECGCDCPGVPAFTYTCPRLERGLLPAVGRARAQDTPAPRLGRPTCRSRAEMFPKRSAI